MRGQGRPRAFAAGDDHPLAVAGGDVTRREQSGRSGRAVGPDDDLAAGVRLGQPRDKPGVRGEADLDEDTRNGNALAVAAGGGRNANAPDPFTSEDLANDRVLEMT